MATKKFSLAALSLAFIFAACGDDNSSANREQNISDSEDISVSVNEVSGVTQKGPFLMGSKVQMFEISNGRSLNQTGKSFNGKISNDKGEFKIKGSKLASQYVILEASGYYRNEITGKNSNSELTLLAISDVSDRNTINVNLLTHLEYERVNYLVTEQNLKVDEAKKKAQKEILDIFYIDNTDFSNSEDLNIAGASDEDGALLATSVLLQGDQSESQLSELLTKIAIDMEEDGEWNDEAKKNAIADWAAETVLSGRIATIRSNVEKWQLSSIVPNFEKHINNFWWTNYGLGTCDEKREGEVLQNSNAQSATNGEYFICADGSWRKATDIEKDTYKWLETLKQSKDGDSKYGDVIKTNCYVYEDKVWRSGNENDCSLELRGCTALRQDTIGKGSDKAWYICDAKSWRDATTYEKDTFGWKDSTDGAIKKGNVTDSIYVFDKTAWRATNNVEAKLGGCVSTIADSVGKVSGTYYICKSNEWVEASTIEYDTYRWVAGKDGDSKSGSVNTTSCYVFETSAWRSGNASDCSLKLRGCTALRQDTIGKGSDKVWHICDAKSWRDATTYEKDTFGWKDSTDGAIKKGNVTDSIYVFDKTAWRAASNIEAKLGGCVNAIADSVGNVDNTYYICKSNTWVEASAIEYDTYRWIAKNDGEVLAGQVNKTIYYIYESKNKAWRNATTYEKDTYDHKNNKDWADGTDGEIRKGSITDTIYVFDKTAWRVADDIEKMLGGCVTAIQDSVGKVGNSYYICNPRKWNIATTLQYDTYKHECTEDGKLFYGIVNTTKKYVCDNSELREASSIETEADSACTSYNRNKYYILPKYDGKSNYSYYKCTEEGWSFTTEKINKGTLVDERDGHEYKTIGIKNQLWMAENLNYADSAAYPSMIGKNWCFDNDEDNCIKNGRLYDGEAALHSSVNTEINYSTIVQGICPNGWHVPNCLDWVRLDDAQDTIYHFYDGHPGMYILGGNEAMTTHYDEGTFVKDEVNFSSSYWSSYGNYDWSTGEYYEGCDNSGIGYYWTKYSNGASFDYGCGYLGYSTCGFPVRCIKDDE